MITESEIDKSIVRVENKAEASQEADLIVHPEFADYIGAEIVSNLSDYENHVLAFCLSVIYDVVKKKGTSKSFDIDAYQNYEENNWALRDNSTKFQDSVNLFFKDYHEEDLLAFVEDMIAEDDESMLSIAGKEIIFITCKSYIDTIC